MITWQSQSCHYPTMPNGSVERLPRFLQRMKRFRKSAPTELLDRAEHIEVMLNYGI